MRNFLVAGISILRFFAAFILFSLILQKRISITLTLLGVLFLIDIREWFLQRRELESMERVFLALSESLVIIAGVGASFLAGLFTIWDAYGLVLREVFLFLLLLVLLFLFRRFPSRVLQPSPVEHWIRMVQYLAFGSGLVSLTGAVHVLSFLTFILGILSSWRMVKIALLHSEKRKTYNYCLAIILIIMGQKRRYRYSPKYALLMSALILFTAFFLSQSDESSGGIGLTVFGVGEKGTYSKSSGGKGAFSPDQTVNIGPTASKQPALAQPSSPAQQPQPSPQTIVVGTPGNQQTSGTITQPGISAASATSFNFTHILIDANGPQNIEVSAVGDIDKDGFTDVLIGGAVSTTTDLVWYKSPGQGSVWSKNLIKFGVKVAVDGKVGDIDNDGDIDVLVSDWYGSNKLEIHWNLDGNGTSWSPEFQIPGSRRMHDIHLQYYDDDTDLDIAARSQTLFNENQGHQIWVFRQEAPTTWTLNLIQTDPGEGLATGDIDGDTYLDLAVSGKWYKNPGSNILQTWPEFTFAPSSWNWTDTQVDIGDIDNDGDPDIVITPAEQVGETYKISWFEAPPDPTTGPWIEHVVDPSVEAVHHGLELGDADLDGDLDIYTSEMSTGANPDEVKVYENQVNIGQLTNWNKFVVDTIGSHSIDVFDFDNDLDVDFVGGNFNSNDVDLWENNLNLGSGVCGNGIIEISNNEQCDDGNTVNGDGCSSMCQEEAGWVCSGQPSTCTPLQLCNLTGASWSATSVVEGTSVTLTTTTQNCNNGEQISIEILEDDGLFGQDITGFSLLNVVVNNNIATTTWNTVWQQDSDGTTSDPEYVFEATLVSDPTQQVQSGILTVVQSSLTQCNDGFDNDLDSLTDYPNDYGCTGANDTDESDSLTNNLVAYYNLDNNVNDISNNGNDGVFFGGTSPNYVPGMKSNAVQFDGVDDYVQLTTNYKLPVYNELNYSIAMWVKSSAIQSDKRVYSEGSSSNGNTLHTLGTGTSPDTNKARIFIRSDSNSIAVGQNTNSVSFEDGNWHNLILTNNNGNIQIYVDGNLDTSVSYNKAGYVLTPNRAAIGAQLKSTALQFFNGSIDEVRIYNRILNSNEISLLAGIPPPPAICGDNYCDVAGGEDPVNCFADCGCGNNQVNPEFGEVCDPPGSTQSCAIGGYPGSQPCSSDCISWGACTTTLYCGDGSIDGPEQCDDANTNNGDGCSSTCIIEAGWTCSGEPSICNQDCDVDNDGFNGIQCSGNDCNDNDASVYPGAPEICDNKDNQCPGDTGYGQIDEGCPAGGPEAIAVWAYPDSVTVSGTENIGVVAYHKNGIGSVTFSVDGGVPITITQETINPDTNEYEWVLSLDTATLPDDASHTITATAYPNAGTPNTLRPLIIQVDNTPNYKTIYVDANAGNDVGGCGASSSPCKTLKQAYVEASSGDTIKLRTGTYTLDVPTDYGFTKYVTTTPDNGHSPRITSNTGTIRSGFLKFKDIVFDWSQRICPCSGDMFKGSVETHYWFDNASFLGPDPTLSNANYFANNVRGIIGTNYFVVENSKFQYLGKAMAIGGTYVARNNEIGPLPQDAFNFNDDNVLITNNFIHDLRGPLMFIDSQNTENFDVSLNKALTVYHDNDNDGIYEAFPFSDVGASAANPSAATAQEIANELNKDPNFAGYQRMNASAFNGKLRITATYNSVVQCIYVQGSANTPLNFVETDISTATCGSGQHADVFQSWNPYKDVIIRNNLVTNHGQGLLMSSSAGTTLENFAFVNNVLDAWDEGPWVIKFGGAGITVKNVLFEHNTIWDRVSQFTLSSGTFIDLYVRNNILGPGTSVGDIYPTMDYNLYDLWKSPPQLNQNSILTNPNKLKPTPTPLFVNVQAVITDITKNEYDYFGDFHTNVNSPGRDQGTAAAGIFYDRDFNLRDAFPDIGAYEYGATGGLCNNNGACGDIAGENCLNCVDCACPGGTTCQAGQCVVPVCGNGLIEIGETCDDNNQVSGDGCSSTCQIEAGWICSGQPSVCQQITQCNDGIDNDADQAIDSADFACQQGGPNENSFFAQCQNGIDDDGDNSIDYPLDPGCTGTQDNDEQDIGVNGLTAYWTFDEGTGTLATDSTGNGNDGTLIGGPAWITNTALCKIGGCLQFDGSDDYVQIAPVTLPVYNLNQYTIAMWVKGPAAQGSPSKRVYSEGHSVDQDSLFTLGTAGSNSGGLDVFIRNDAASVLLSQGTGDVAFDNTWHHVAWVDNNGVGVVYIDGVQDTNNPFSYTKGPISLNRVAIGAQLKSGPNWWFNGTIDDVQIYNRALNQNEILAIMGGSTGGSGFCGDALLNGNEQCDYAAQAGSTNNNCGLLSVCDTSCICVPATCSIQNGTICQSNEYCQGTQITATDTNFCCQGTCVAQTQCSDCGIGWFNACDRSECYGLQEGCYFIDNPGLQPDTCSSCSSAVPQACEVYDGDTQTCSEDILNCGFSTATTIQSCQFDTLQTNCISCTDTDLDTFSGTDPLLCGQLDCDDDPSDDPVICSGSVDCSQSQYSVCAACKNPSAVESCSDNVDNNCNNLVDCNDPGCVNAQQCLPPACGLNNIILTNLADNSIVTSTSTIYDSQIIEARVNTLNCPDFTSLQLNLVDSDGATSEIFTSYTATTLGNTAKINMPLSLYEQDDDSTPMNTEYFIEAQIGNPPVTLQSNQINVIHDDNVYYPQEKCPNTVAATVNLNDGCPLPKATVFTQVTDFTSLSSLLNAQNVVLGNTGVASVTFIDDINVTRWNGSNGLYESLDLDSVNIQANTVGIDDTLLPELDRQAMITLYGLTFTSPVVLKDGQPCNQPECVIISYNNGDLSFSVQGFSEYLITGEATYQGAEASTSTGSSSSGGSSGGGGGGGGSSGLATMTVDLDKNEIVTLTAPRYTKFNVVYKGTTYLMTLPEVTADYIGIKYQSQVVRLPSNFPFRFELDGKKGDDIEITLLGIDTRRWATISFSKIQPVASGFSTIINQPSPTPIYVETPETQPKEELPQQLPNRKEFLVTVAIWTLAVLVFLGLIFLAFIRIKEFTQLYSEEKKISDKKSNKENEY